MPERTNYNRLKIRVEYREEENEKITGAVVSLLEHLRFEVLEWSRPFPIRQDPGSGMARAYITAVKKGANE